jgi:hypothetical protein
MMTEIYDALDDCLNALERGQALEAALVRYPELADQLRPLLVASLMARGSSRLHVSTDVRRRGRARLLQQASILAESKAAVRRPMIPIFPRVAITAALVAALVLTSTGLVSAASATLPGQELYPVKRTWESVRLLFVFTPEQRDLLESDYEQERLNEISQLLGRRLAAPISFSGLLSKRSDGQWLISGIRVSVTASTTLPSVPIADGAPVTVTGTTRDDGLVEAQQITVLEPGSALPPFEPSENHDQSSGGSGEDGSTIGRVGSATPQSPEPDSERASYQFSGVVESVQGNIWRINGQPVYVDGAQIKGKVRIGTIVKFEGYYGADGRFIVTRIEAASTSVDRNRSGNGSDGSGGEKPEGGGGEGGGGGDP